MNDIDWWVVGLYLVGMLVLAALVGRRQRSRQDYYLGGNRMPPLALATSTLATQCSTNSLLGAPAFVGFVVGGGMIWLQYEIAVPLAMLALMVLLGPMRRQRYISIYAFLEDRLGVRVRLLASTSFQIFRGIATGVTVYGVALVVTILLDVTYTQAVLILMGVTIVYDVLGGMRAVVISDVVQMVLILVAVIVSLFMLADTLGGFAPMFVERTDALNFSWGLRDADSYGFWPMLIGGFFLYAAYYGCDQSQAQRVLAARSAEETRLVLLYNGVLRFPIVLLYCVLGLALAAYATVDEGFVPSLPSQSNGQPNFNLAYPAYVLQTFPPGLVGLVLVGIFAAAMSSIDSALNSLSATTVEDFLNRGGRLSERAAFIASKVATVGWGLFAIAFSYQVENIAPTVLEAINKIGSMVNGPLLALFTLALVARGVGQNRAIAGFCAGLVCNAVLWLGFPGVSWLWWNASGFLVAILVAMLGRTPATADLGGFAGARSTSALGAMAGIILAVCIGFTAL